MKPTGRVKAVFADRIIEQYLVIDYKILQVFKRLDIS